MKVVSLVFFAGLGTVCLSAPMGVADVDQGIYVVTVGDGSTATLTGDDLAAAEGFSLVKRGGGTLYADGAMGPFAGEIRIEEGVYYATDNGALGTDAGATVVSNGAALHYAHPEKDKLTFTNETITIAGAGPDGKGALFHTDDAIQQYRLFVSGGTLSLSDDAMIGGNYNYGAGYDGELRLNGHTMTVSNRTSSIPVNLNFASFATPGHIDVIAGAPFLRTATEWSGGPENTFTIREGSQLRFNDIRNPFPWTLVLEDDTVVYPSGGNPVGADDDFNVFSGPVVLQGTSTVAYDGNQGGGTGVRFTGPVSGEGGFRVNYTNELWLSNSGNTFKGGVFLNGSGPGCRLVVDVPGAVPDNGDPITVRRGTVQVNGSCGLPDVVCTREGLLTNTMYGTSVELGNVSKTGIGDFGMVGGFSVTNRFDVGGGDVYLGSAVPSMESGGCHMAYSNFTDYAAMEDFCGFVLKANAESYEVPSAESLSEVAGRLFESCGSSVVSGFDHAFKDWSSSETYSLRAYRGFFLNNDPTNVLVTFVTSVADLAFLEVDGRCVLMNNGSNRVQVESTGKTMTYFVTVSEPVVLQPGATGFLLMLGHSHTSTKGARWFSGAPEVCGHDWVEKRGFVWRYGTNAVDETKAVGQIVNPAEYSNVVNTKDRILFAPDNVCRPSVAALAFGGETVSTLDLGDDGMGQVDSVVDLEGTARIRNGTLEVSGRWKVDSGSMANGPLTVEEDASLVFSDGAKVVATARELKRMRGTALAVSESGGTISGLPQALDTETGVAASHYYTSIEEKDDGGFRLLLNGIPFGTVFVIR